MYKYFLFALFLALFTGCARQTTTTVTTQDHNSTDDYNYKEARSNLKGEPVPYPDATPYDADGSLRKIYFEGFKHGWDVTIEYWIGNLISYPDEYPKSSPQGKAWIDGFDAGTKAVSTRVEIKKETEPKQ